MHRLASLILVALVSTACSASAPTLAPTPLPTAPQVTTPPVTTSAVTAPPSAAPTPRVTPTPVPPAVTCPTGTPLTVHEFVEADTDCFTGIELTMRVWLDFSPPLGWEGPGIEPSWLAYPVQDGPAALWQVPPTGEDNICNSDVAADCAWFFAHIDPASGVKLGVDRRWLTVTGHIADPASATCHFVPYEGMDEPLPDAAFAIETCISQFVVTSVAEAS